MVLELLAAALSHFVFLFLWRTRPKPNEGASDIRMDPVSTTLLSARDAAPRRLAPVAPPRRLSKKCRTLPFGEFHVLLMGQFVVSDVGSYEVRPSLVRILATEDAPEVCPLEEKRLGATARKPGYTLLLMEQLNLLSYTITKQTKNSFALNLCYF